MKPSRWKRGAVCEEQSSANGGKKLLRSQFTRKRFLANSPRLTTTHTKGQLSSVNACKMPQRTRVSGQPAGSLQSSKASCGPHPFRLTIRLNNDGIQLGSKRYKPDEAGWLLCIATWY